MKNPTTPDTSAKPEVIGPNKEDLVSFSITPGATVHGVTTFTGTVKNGYFFEGNIVVHILDASKTHEFETHGTATSDWMTSGPVTFTSTVDFSKLSKGPAYIELHNDNASGEEKNEKTIDIPIVIQ